MSNEETAIADSKIARGNEMTEMAVQRTVMAADRSLMAWVRTGLSLISFGFTIYKFLEYSSAQIIATGKVLGDVSGPKVLGLFMIGMGILSLVLGTIENVFIIKGLRAKYNISRPRYALLMAGILTLLGIVMFMSIILRVSIGK